MPSRCLSAPPARLKSVSVRHAVEVDYFLVVNASWLIFGTEFLFSLFKYIFVFHLLLDPGPVPDMKLLKEMIQLHNNFELQLLTNELSR